MEKNKVGWKSIFSFYLTEPNTHDTATPPLSFLAGVDNGDARCHGDVESSQDGEVIVPLKVQMADNAYRVTLALKKNISCVLCNCA